MAIIKSSKIRESTDAELQAKLFEFQKELNSERGMVATGGRTSNPGKIRELRRSVARVITIMHERKLGIARKVKAAVAPAKADAAKK
jgi:large subunit ribosomal protein L29